MATRILELRSVWGTGGGPEKTILVGAARADRRRFSVTVCYLRDDRDPDFGIDRRALALGVDYAEIRERHSFDVRIWPELRRLVCSKHIDIVHSHDYKTDLLALLLAKTDRIVPLSTVHGWSGTSARERLLYYPADRKLLTRFPRVIVVSPVIRRQLLASGVRPERVTLLPNGIDASVFRRDSSRRDAMRQALGIAPGQRVVGTVSRLEAIKRVDALVNAFGRLLRSRPGLRLLVAGDGSLRASLEGAAERLAPGACTFLGHYPDVVGLHHALDVFVQSSDSEGTSNAVLEAMAMETPVVATDVGGTSALIRHEVDGLLVPAGDFEALNVAIGRTLDDPAAATVRTRRARSRVEEELSFGARMARVEAIYEELALTRGPASRVVQAS